MITAGEVTMRDRVNSSSKANDIPSSTWLMSSLRTRLHRRQWL